MKQYALKRLLGMIPLLIGITIISFGMMHLAPGEPSVVGSEFNPKVSTQDIERLRAHYGLDKPLYEQYWNWMKRLAVLDFGTPFHRMPARFSTRWRNVCRLPSGSIFLPCF
jgi:peptide/nickel transport system permease protein